MAKDNEIFGALTGAAGSALWFWNETENDRSRRLRDLRDDQRDTESRLDALLLSGDWSRITLPTNRDYSIGLAAANPAAAMPSTVPPLGAAAVRPDLTGGANIQSNTYPPRIGTYDETGRTAQPGDLAYGALVSTYQEPRAWEQGLTLKNPPTAAQQWQIFLAAQGLSAFITAQNWTAAQWAVFWASMAGGNALALDPHQDPSRAPTATPQGPSSTVVPLPGNPVTDACSRWRISLGASNANVNDVLAHVSFKSEYRYSSGGAVASFQPIVLVTKPSPVIPSNISSLGFDLVANNSIPGSSVLDVFVAVLPGVPTV